MAAHYQTGQICVACIVGCLDCTEGATCDRCDTDNNFISDANKKCVCKDDTLYLDGTVCKICSSILTHCTRCSGADHCLECADPFVVNDDKKCGCPKGKFIN